MQQTPRLTLKYKNTPIFDASIMMQRYIVEKQYQYFVREVQTEIIFRLLNNYLKNPTLLNITNQPFDSINGLPLFPENIFEEEHSKHKTINQINDLQKKCENEHEQPIKHQITSQEGKNQMQKIYATANDQYNNSQQILLPKYKFQQTPADIFVKQQSNHQLQNELINTTLMTKNIQYSSLKIYEKQQHSKSQVVQSNNYCLIKKQYTPQTTLKRQFYSQVLKVQALPKCEKTTNIPKFLIKSFRDYFRADSKELPFVWRYFPKIRNFFSKLKTRNKSKNAGALAKLLTQYEIDQPVLGQTRRLMHHILNKRKKQSIISNNKVRIKKFYLISTKTYRLRCRSKILVERLSIR